MSLPYWAYLQGCIANDKGAFEMLSTTIDAPGGQMSEKKLFETVKLFKNRHPYFWTNNVSREK